MRTTETVPHRLDQERRTASPSSAALFACACACVLAPRPAAAEAPGLVIGRYLVIHPGFTSELRYDSNVFFSNARAPGGLPVGAFVLRLSPTVSIATTATGRGAPVVPRRVVFRVQGSLDYREFLSADADIRAHRMLGGELAATLALFPQGTLGLEIYEHYQRTTQPPYSLLPYNFNRNLAVFGARGRYAPGSGRLISTLLLELGYDGYDDVDNGPKLSDFNVVFGNMALRSSWKFLPKTALYVELNQGFYHNLSPNAAVQQRSDSLPFRVGAGLLGLLTARLSMQLFGGYGNGFYLNGPSPSTGIVQVELRYKPTHFSAASLTYRHDFSNSVLGTYFDLDSVGAAYTHSIFRVLLSARLTWDRMAFRGSADVFRNAGVCKDGDIAPCDPQLDRVDNLIAADVRGEYPLREWLSLGAGYGLMTNQSNAYTRVRQAITPVTFFKHEAFLRCTLRY